jgi:NADH:ubiquinone oxidoreductase subunit 4 (subunit M)
MLFFTVATLGLPGTANFVGEIYVIAESFRQNPSLGILLAVAVVFAAAYSLRLFLLTMHGPSAGRVRNLPDATSSDITVLASLTTAIIIFGFAPAAVVPARVIVAEVESVKMTPAQRPRIPSTPALSVRQTILPRQSPKDDATTSTQPTMEATR